MASHAEIMLHKSLKYFEKAITKGTELEEEIHPLEDEGVTTQENIAELQRKKRLINTSLSLLNKWVKKVKEDVETWEQEIVDLEDDDEIKAARKRFEEAADEPADGLGGGSWLEVGQKADELIPQLQSDLEEIKEMLKNLQDHQNEPEPPQAVPLPAPPQPVMRVRPPEIRLETFEGDYLKYTPWTQMFLALYPDSVSPVLKFNALLAHLGGEAKRLLTGMSVTNENFPIAWKTLQDKYDRPLLVKRRLFDDLQKLPSVRERDTKQLLHFHEKAEIIFRIYDERQIPLEGQNLMDTLLSKLPPDMLIELENSRQNRQVGEWTIEEFRSALAKLAHLRQTIQIITDTGRRPQGPSQLSHSDRYRPRIKTETPEDTNTSAFVAIQQRNSPTSRPNYSTNRQSGTSRTGGGPFSQKGVYPSGKRTNWASQTPQNWRGGQNKPASGRQSWRPNACMFCKGLDHFSSQCTVISSVENRKQWLNKNARCLRCTKLKQNCQWPCRSQIVCHNCKQSNTHPTSLCTQRYASAQQSSKPTRPTGTQNPARTRSTVVAAPSVEHDVWTENPRNGVRLHHFPTQGEQENWRGNMVTSVLVSNATVKAEEQPHKGHLITALVDVQHPHQQGIKRRCTAFVDTGCHRSFIRKDVADDLGLLTSTPQTIKVNRFNDQGVPQDVYAQECELNMVAKNGQVLNMKILAVQSPVPKFRAQALCNEEREFLAQEFASQLADINKLNEDYTVEPELLIGADYISSLQMWKRIEVPDYPQLILLDSILGVLVTGGRNESPEEKNNQKGLVLSATEKQRDPDLHLIWDIDRGGQTPREDDIESFWRVEGLGSTHITAADEDQIAMEHFNQVVQRDEEGRYCVGFPWIEPSIPVPDNFLPALAILKSMLRKYSTPQNRSLLLAVKKIFDTQMAESIIEEVNVDTPTGPRVTYIPWLLVEKPGNPTTPVRVVFNGSYAAKGKPSINDTMFRGPNLVPELPGVILKFRRFKYGITGDIRKAYLTIKLIESDKDATRFLWVRDIKLPADAPGNLTVNRFNRVPFGYKASQHLLSATVSHHLNSKEDAVINDLTSNCYVDNVITGSDSELGAIEKYKVMVETFREIQMHLTQIGTNSPQLRRQVQSDDLVAGEQNVLGLRWDPQTDKLFLPRRQRQPQETRVTKRVMLKQTAGVFDPLGIVSPVVLRAKLMIQKAWVAKMEWDEPMSETVQNEWTEVLENLFEVHKMKVSRYIGADIKATDNTLVTFVDASGFAYGSVTYLHQQIQNGGVMGNLLWAKSRLVPPPTAKKKALTIPRAELLALRVGCRQTEYVAKNLDAPIHRTIIYCDSQVVLAWLKTKKPTTVFVQRAVKEILENTNYEFRYIESQNNPADILSRGATMNELLTDPKWLHGPYWFGKPVLEWPPAEKVVNAEILAQIQQEVKVQPVHYMVTTRDDRVEERVLCFERFGTFNKAVHVAVQVLRFLNMFTKGKESFCGLPASAWSKLKTRGDYSAAEIRLGKLVVLQQTQRQGLDPTKPQSALTNKALNAKRDPRDNLFKCHGRMTNADLPISAKFPILLPYGHDATKLLIKRIHEENCHSIEAVTLSKLRQNYWIPKGRQLVRAVQSACVTCTKQKNGPFRLPDMAAIPAVRLTEQRPFRHVIIDYMGPINVRLGGHEGKAWVCLFGCLVSRALHLELAFDLSAKAFLDCIRRFIARRSRPKTIRSDNQSAFKLVQKIINLPQGAQPPEYATEVESFFADREIEWHFTVEFAPWRNATIERIVAEVKKALRRSIGRKKLSSEDLRTLIVEVEAVVNSRPLTVLDTSDVQGIQLLRPLDLLGQYDSCQAPLLNETDEEEYTEGAQTPQQKLVASWRQATKLLDHFWQIWIADYLPSLRERTATTIQQGRILSKTSPRVGQLVLVHQDLAPRGTWKVGRVIALPQGEDGMVRDAHVLMPNKSVRRRPLNLLYPFEVQDERLTPREDESENEREKQLSPDQENERENLLASDAGDKREKQLSPRPKNQRDTSLARGGEIQRGSPPTPLDKQEKRTPWQRATPAVTRSRAAKMLLPLTLLCLMVTPLGASICSNKTLEQGRVILSDTCVEDGTIVMRMGKETCTHSVTCSAGKQLTESGECGHTCGCPSWATQCLHLIQTPPFAPIDNQTLRAELEELQPSVCGWAPSSQCDDVAQRGIFHRIQLMSGETHLVNRMSIQAVSQKIPEKPKCVGDNNGSVLGTDDYCATHKCQKQPSKNSKFCFLPIQRLLFYVTNKMPIPIRAHGQVELSFYGEIKSSKEREDNACALCKIECTKGGVVLDTTENISLAELCTPYGCLTIPSPKHMQNVPLSPETTMYASDVAVTLWKNGMRIKHVSVHCSANPYCEQISCHMCWAKVLNPQCWEVINVIVMILLIYLLSLTVYTVLRALTHLTGCIKGLLRCICCTTPKTIKCAAQVIRKLGRMCCCGRIKKNKLAARLRSRMRTEDVEEIPLIKRPRGQITSRRQNKWLNMCTVVIALCHLCSLSNACVDSVSVTAVREVCQTTENGTKTCAYTNTIILTLPPTGHRSCLLMYGDKNELQGQVEITTEGIHLECQRIIHYYTRSFRMNYGVLKSCNMPFSKACSSDKCAKIGPDDAIPELGEAINNSPGRTSCLLSSSAGGWDSGCFAAVGNNCLYYRQYAEAIDNRTYAIISCPTWNVYAKIRIRIRTNTFTEERSFILSNIQNIHWKHTWIGLLNIFTPPMPILGTKFAQDVDTGQTILIEGSAAGFPLTGTPGQLQCKTETQARDFKCHLSADPCQCHALADTVNCLCTSVNLKHLFEDRQRLLPIVIHDVTLKPAENSGITATTRSTGSASIQVSIENMRLRSKVEHNICSVTVDGFGGCYSCLTGAFLNITCRANHGQALALINCNGLQFAAHCTEEGQENRIMLNFGRAQIEEECQVVCPSGRSQFLLKADLAFIQHSRNAISEHPKNTTETRRQEGFDLLSILDLGGIDIPNPVKLLSNFLQDEWKTALIILIMSVFIIIAVLLTPQIITCIIGYTTRTMMVKLTRSPNTDNKTKVG